MLPGSGGGISSSQYTSGPRRYVAEVEVSLSRLAGISTRSRSRCTSFYALSFRSARVCSRSPSSIVSLVQTVSAGKQPLLVQLPLLAHDSLPPIRLSVCATLVDSERKSAA